MYCSNCGKQVSDSAKVCGYCGHKLKPKKAAAKPSKAATKPDARNQPEAAPKAAVKVAAVKQPKAAPKAAARTKFKIPVWVWGIVGVLVLALVAWLVMPGLLGGTPTGQAASGNSILGEWESVDLDGSHMTLEVQQQAGGVYTLKYYDEMASSCGGVPATASGQGHVQTQNTILVTITYECMGGDALGTFTVAYHYDLASDTIREESPEPGVSVTWERSN